VRVISNTVSHTGRDAATVGIGSDAFLGDGQHMRLIVTGRRTSAILLLVLETIEEAFNITHVVHVKMDLTSNMNRHYTEANKNGKQQPHDDSNNLY
jgi:hypothetical protein